MKLLNCYASTKKLLAVSEAYFQAQKRKKLSEISLTIQGANMKGVVWILTRLWGLYSHYQLNGILGVSGDQGIAGG